MRKVAIVSFETSNFEKKSTNPILEVAAETCVNLFKKSSLSKNSIEALFFSSCTEEQYTASIVSQMIGLKPKFAHRIDNLCNSGTDSIISAYSYIASGLCDCALVVGVDGAKSPGKQLLWDISRGSFNFPVHWASLYAKCHMRKYGTTEEQMATVTVKNRFNAQRNPKAVFNEAITTDDVMHSKRIVDPIKMLDCSLPCSGSSAAILMSEDKAKQLIDNPVWIKGIGRKTLGAGLGSITGDLSSIEAAKNAARIAYKMANVEPDSIDVIELHDAFSILEIIAYEDLGLVSRGMGGKYVNLERTNINPRGGLLGCGHPIGATGVAQTVEIAAQLSEQAEGRQIKGCKTGLVQNLAAAGTSATVIILGV